MLSLDHPLDVRQLFLEQLSILNGLSRRVIWVGSTRCDWRVLLQAPLEIHYDLHDWPRTPRLTKSGLRIFLFGVGNEVERFRLSKFGRRSPPVSLLVVEDGFPMTPLNS